MNALGRVLITGASRGIGQATALALAQKGYDLALLARTGADLDATAQQCQRHGADVTVAVADVSDPTAVLRAVHAALPVDDPLAGLVLNAGGGVWNSLSQLTDSDWQQGIDTNLGGAFHVLRACLPRLTANPHGLVVGVLSDSALYPFANRSVYAASKAGMRALLDVARLELQRHGTRVSLLYPSRVDTYFRGSHAEARPGTRAGALDAHDVATVIACLFQWPQAVEIREIHMSSTASDFGPFSRDTNEGGRR